MSCGCRVNWSFLLLWPSRRTLYISPPLAARGIRQNWSLFIGKSPKIVLSHLKKVLKKQKWLEIYTLVVHISLLVSPSRLLSANKRRNEVLSKPAIIRHMGIIRSRGLLLRFCRNLVMANTREIIDTLWTSELETRKVKESMEKLFSSSFLALAWCIFFWKMRKRGVFNPRLSSKFQRNDASWII